MSVEDFIVKYGNVSLLRAWCNLCESYSFVDEDEQILLCCGIDYIPKKKRVNINASDSKRKRRSPSNKRKLEILEDQNNSCVYCQIKFGEAIVKKNKVIWLRICWDHFIPFCYEFNNANENFVAACQICNGIKSGKIFEDLEDARFYVLERRRKKGYIYPPEVEEGNS